MKFFFPYFVVISLECIFDELFGDNDLFLFLTTYSYLIINLSTLQSAANNRRVSAINK